MLSLQETIDDQNSLNKLCEDRAVPYHEFFPGNCYYGNEYILKLYANFPEKYLIKINIPHGVQVGLNVWEEEIKSQLPAIFTYSNNHLEVCEKSIKKNRINKHTIPAAMPFLYLLDLLKGQPKPLRKGTIFFPSHSSHHVTTTFDLESMVEHLMSLDEKFQPVTVCVYWKDFLLGQHLPFEKKGMKIVSAGHIYDKLFLSRLYHLCSTHRYSTSNEFGAPIFFSIKSGCSYFYTSISKCFLTAENAAILSRDVPPFPTETIDIIQALFSTPVDNMSIGQMNVVDYFLGSKYFKSKNDLQNELYYAEQLFRNAQITK